MGPRPYLGSRLFSDLSFEFVSYINIYINVCLIFWDAVNEKIWLANLKLCTVWCVDWNTHKKTVH